MNKSELTPLWKTANNNLSSISSTVRASLLKRVMKSCPRKFLNFPCLMRFSIYCFKSKHSFVSCPWSLWKWQYLFRLRLLGSPFIFSGHFKEGSSLICIRTCLSGVFNGVYCWFRVEGPAFFISVFLIFYPSLLWTRSLLRMTRRVYFYSLSSLPLLGYDCVLCIYKVLGWMNQRSEERR